MSFITLNQLMLYTDDFFFLQPENDTIVVCNPQDAICITPVFLHSRKSLEEHIRYINENQVKKAVIVAENIEFIRQCPSLEVLSIFPALSAKQFDFSPLYDLPAIKCLCCDTMYGEDEKKVSTVDYSKLKGLNCLRVNGKKGHLNLEKVHGLKTLYLADGQPKGDDLVNAFDASNLEKLSLTMSPIRSLNGIEQARNLKILELDSNRRLEDISAIAELGDTLQSLEINSCGKIKDFSALSKLHKLEQLYLMGTNTIPNLDFLKNMPNLKAFKLFMNVEDGRLGNCAGIPWVMIKGRKHYDHKEKDFTQISVETETGKYSDYE